MGLTAAGAAFLAEAAGAGVTFGRTLTIGRQRVLLGPDRIWNELSRVGIHPAISKGTFRRQLGWDAWADPFFHLLGAEDVKAIDVSNYEGSALVHDLNEPVPAELHEQFDVVFDGGSLEHIFNVPVALRSYMEMVAVGGRLFVHTPANNYFGHGLYQFSAEFFYRTLSDDAGYSVERMLLCTEDTDAPGRVGARRFAYTDHGPRYEVADPRAVGQRVTLVDDQPAMLLVQAKRIARKPIFSEHPKQSDYAAAWRKHESPSVLLPGPRRAVTDSAATMFARRLPPSVRARIVHDVLLRIHQDWVRRLMPLLDPRRRRRAMRERSLTNRTFYRRIDR